MTTVWRLFERWLRALPPVPGAVVDAVIITLLSIPYLVRGPLERQGPLLVLVAVSMGWASHGLRTYVRRADNGRPPTKASRSPDASRRDDERNRRRAGAGEGEGGSVAAPFPLAVVLALAMTAFACGENAYTGPGSVRGVEDSILEPLDAGDGTLVPSDEATPSNGVDPGMIVLASGGGGEGRWRLVALDTSFKYVGDVLCVETARPDAPPRLMCGGSAEYSGGSVATPVLGAPTLAGEDPAIVFGTVSPSVTRVVVDLRDGGAVNAQLVGPERLHYVAALPSGASPDTVSAYDAQGNELARRGLIGAETASASSWESCVPGEDGAQICSGGASGAGSTTATGGVQSDPNGS